VALLGPCCRRVLDTDLRGEVRDGVPTTLAVASEVLVHGEIGCLVTGAVALSSGIMAVIPSDTDFTGDGPSL